MKLISITIGEEQTLVHGHKSEQTGIFKQPVGGPVQVTALGIPGDFIGSPQHHGGPDQAVYVYGKNDYDWWESQLGRQMFAGMFGENLTIDGLESGTFNIGDRLHFGGVILEVTAPRIPCGTLAGRMGIPEFVKLFRHAERPGLYCRVIQEGSLKAGDDVRWEKFAGETISIVEALRDFYEPELTKSAIKRILAAPIAIRMRKDKEEQLEKVLAGK